MGLDYVTTDQCSVTHAGCWTWTGEIKTVSWEGEEEADMTQTPGNAPTAVEKLNFYYYLPSAGD